MIDRDYIEDHTDTVEFLNSNNVKTVTVSNYKTNYSFPIPVVHRIKKTDSNIIFTYTNIHNYIKKKMINKKTSVNVTKEMIDLYNEGHIEFKNKLELELKNYPLIALEKNDEVQISSLSSKGKLNPKHTYIGEFMINEYINYYISRDRRISDSEQLLKEDLNIVRLD